ncbi:hypothetical protein ABUS21_04740 [Acinetobacter baumannii]|uniref:hypothetical protein n=1 Tax=Acinetobacter baumannii TaxID=470 RepID=UPI003CFD5073
MTLNEREALVAQIEEFKKDAMELWFVPELAASYKNMDMFSYSIVENNEVFFMREQARQLWSFWNKAKAQAVPTDYVIVPKELPLEMALKIAEERILEQPPVKDLVLNEVLEKAYKENLQNEQCRLIRDYKEVVKRLGESGAEK